MAEVLSQNQIDALLNAVQNHSDAEISIDADGKDDYREYDFASPRKFTKDRIKMLNGIFDNYSRIANSLFSAKLRMNCEVAVESIEEQRYFEFSNALTEGDVLALMDVSIKGRPAEDIPCMLYISTPMALSIIDRMLGGDGAQDERLPDNYTYTDLELRLYEELARDLVSINGRSWENYIPVDFTYSKTDINPTLSQIMGLDEIVIIVNLVMQTDNSVGSMSICLPSEILKNIFTEINSDNHWKKAQTENKSQEIFDSLRDSRLEIVSVLGEVQLSLSDIYSLAPGDIIDLGKPRDSSVYLDIGNYHWFRGHIGTHKKNYAVSIDEVINPAPANQS